MLAEKDVNEEVCVESRSLFLSTLSFFTLLQVQNLQPHTKYAPHLASAKSQEHIGLACFGT
jgi:hypothetical protein